MQRGRPEVYRSRYLGNTQLIGGSQPLAGMSSQHVVQFYDADETALYEGVAAYIAQGLAAGESVVVVTHFERREALFGVLDRLRTQPDAECDAGRLTVIDSDIALDAMQLAGRINADRFDQVVAIPIREVAARSRSRRMRVYGDMVDTLWQDGRRSEAIDLERYWNDLQAQLPFDLYCAYKIDVFGEDFRAGTLAPVLCEHSRLVPKQENSELQSALEHAMHEMLGSMARDSSEDVSQALPPVCLQLADR